MHLITPERKTKVNCKSYTDETLVMLTLAGGKEIRTQHNDLFERDATYMVAGMTVPCGRERFDPLRNDAKFKTYIERARALVKEGV